MEKKQPTKAQIERRIKNALVFVEKDSETKSVFFDDKGVRLAVTMDKCIVETGYHKHIFDAFNAQGASRPYLYTKRVIELSEENDCIITDKNGNARGRSYAKLLGTLSKKEDKADYNLVYYYSWWLMNIFSPLYTIGNTDIEMFVVYFDYLTVIAKNTVMLAEKTDGMTNKQFIGEFIKNMQAYSDDMQDAVLFEKRTDEDVIKENLEAEKEREAMEFMEENDEQHGAE